MSARLAAPRPTRHRWDGKALAYAILAGLAAAPILFIGLMGLWLSVYLSNGGDFGGYGTGPQQVTGWWVVPFQLVTQAAVVVADVLIMRSVFRWQRRRANPTPTSKRH